MQQDRLDHARHARLFELIRQGNLARAAKRKSMGNAGLASVDAFIFENLTDAAGLAQAPARQTALP